MASAKAYTWLFSKTDRNSSPSSFPLENACDNCITVEAASCALDPLRTNEVFIALTVSRAVLLLYPKFNNAAATFVYNLTVGAKSVLVCIAIFIKLPHVLSNSF